MIEFALDSPEVPVGGRLKGTVRWAPAAETKIRRLIIKAGWRTEGRGDEDEQEVFRAEHPGQTVPAGGLVSVAFEVPIPEDGPITYEGKLIRILWAVECELDIPWASDEEKSGPFRVVPRESSR